jgi:Flp pilus assembly pilin Flp
MKPTGGTYFAFLIRERARRPIVTNPANSIRLSSLDRNGGDNNVGGTGMNLLKRLWLEEDGQGLTEYTLVIVLVALVFWLGVRDTNIGNSLASGWSKVVDCVSLPSSCSP